MGSLALEADGLRLADGHDVDLGHCIDAFALFTIRHTSQHTVSNEGNRVQDLPWIVRSICQQRVGVQGISSVGDWGLQQNVSCSERCHCKQGSCQ